MILGPRSWRGLDPDVWSFGVTAYIKSRIHGLLAGLDILTTFDRANQEQEH